ncbi:MAG: electron transport complex subunit E [Clostridiales bacterium]|nr:electron transport complex subunit E [Clostridiales bacterium]
MKPKEKNQPSYFKEFSKGIIKENPTLVSLLGMCPTLAITNLASNAIGMGLATTFVLVCSNFVLSLLKNAIPKTVRLPCFIVIIAGFVTVVELLMKSYIPSLYSALGIFLPLITVNCIILGRAEAFASKNKVIPSILDGLGMGIGFTLALFAMGSIREIIGSGQWFGLQVLPKSVDNMMIFIMPAGGFFVLGCIIALVNKIANKKPPKEIGCSGCPHFSSCTMIENEENKSDCSKTAKEAN